MSKLLVSSFLVTATTIVVGLVAPITTAQTQPTPPPVHTGPLFQSSAQCMTCHNGLTTASGEDVSFGTMWRASMMAHSARDPYWHAGVRREVTDHPRAQAAIENECSRCHMPMAHVETQRRGGQQSVFANIPSANPAAIDPLALEGCLLRVVSPDYERRTWLKGQLHRRLRHRDSAAGARPSDVRALRGGAWPAIGHAIGYGPAAHRVHAYSALRGLRHVPHALHPRAERIRRGDEGVPGTDALPGMAAQRVPRLAELPVVPHAGGHRAEPQSPRCSDNRGKRCPVTTSAAPIS